jgi:hypothetical protein
MRALVSALCLLAFGARTGIAAGAQEPAATPLRGLERALWREDRAELWILCAEPDGPRVRVFDPWLRERAARPAAEMPDGGTTAAPDAACEVPLWGMRRLQAGADGVLRVLPLWWETTPRLHWGPGWAAVVLRAAQPLPALLWRRAGEAELHVETFVADRFDGALQRASLFGLTAGERIEIALPARQPLFPPRTEPEWHPFVVPAVAPEGARPTSAWPTE